MHFIAVIYRSYSIRFYNLFPKFFSSLFFLQVTDQQMSVLFGYDIAIQALNYHLTFIGCMNHTVLVFIQADIFANFGIAIFIL